MMKHFLLALILAPISIFSQQPAEKRFQIQANINGLPENSEVTISDVNNPSDTVSRAKVYKGQVLLKGTIQEPNLYSLNFAGIQKKTTIFLSNDKIDIKGNAENLQKLEVTGSPANTDFTEFQKIFNPLFQRLTAISQELNSKPRTQAPAENDTLMQSYLQLVSTIKSNIDQFLSTRNSSPVSPFVLLVTSELDPEVTVLENRFSKLDPAVQSGFYGKIVKDQIDAAKIGALGSEAIEFVQNDTTGKPVSLSGFRGKYVLIDFWASWCKPCRMENPNVVNAFNKFKSKNFTVLGISLDRSREPWIQAIKDDNLQWTQLSDLKFWSNEVAVKYRIESIPQNYLIDPQGKIIGKNLRGPELESRLCELLGCN